MKPSTLGEETIKPSPATPIFVFFVTLCGIPRFNAFFKHLPFRGTFPNPLESH
jgi:hypothetical protein